ncbi:MAG: GH116 family glycosyl-hydrolase, partial [Opitutales bacterium]
SFEDLIPSDKKLPPEWIASLTERSQPEVFHQEAGELKYIGMPVGGIGCGQLYLGGDGKLWLWDIFKSNYRREPDFSNRIDDFSLGGNYAHPVAQGEVYNKWIGADVDQGFLIRATAEGKSQTRTLDQNGFRKIRFRGEYPVGKVSYADEGFPASVDLEAFSPFIPVNLKDSALPATVMRYTVRNTSSSPMQVDLGSWMQNATCPYTSDPALGKRHNQLVRNGDRHSLVHTIDGPGGKNGIQSRNGYGSSALSVLADDGMEINGAAELSDPANPEKLFDHLDRVQGADAHSASKALDQLLVGGLNASFTLKPGESKTVTYLITWYFPYHLEQKVKGSQMNRIKDFDKLSRHYRPWFKSADEVADYVARNRGHLIDGTLTWNRTWYDSSLPHWFLDRSMIPLDCVATQVLHWFDNGRPYGWEGVDCCPGTCTHVWHYAQALGRIFPELERAFREEVDFKEGIAFVSSSGKIKYRGDFHDKDAVDGQSGTILRAYREHLTSKDDTFLKRNYPNIKKAIEFLIDQDPDGNGLLEGKQPHTLDASWYGPMGWLSSMYLAALKAGEAMAQEMGDRAFEAQCRELTAKGFKNILTLFNGEYFIHKPDPKYPKALRSGNGCHIDQLLGQAWVHQVGLGRVVPKKETISALESLWKYNFAPDAGAYALKHREIEKAFRWYAMPGEAGLLMTTWPKGGVKEAIPGNALRPEKNPQKWNGPGGYFNECMNGFEYQVAGHMVAEGAPDSPLVKKGLAIMKAVHERYGAAKRNPYNEIECSDHYARSMASYGIFLAACGFLYHGPKGAIGFNPKVQPHDFKAAFTAAEGWGQFSQSVENGKQSNELKIRYGNLKLNELKLVNAPGTQPGKAVVTLNGKRILTRNTSTESPNVYRFPDTLHLSVGDTISIQQS